MGRITPRSTVAAAMTLPLMVAVIFVLGVHSEQYWNQFVRSENIKFGDVLQVDVAESYRNLTLKILHALQWATDHYPKSQYIMKADDDVYVNLPYLLHELASRAVNSSQILGALSTNSPVNRDVRDDWGVTLREYPLHTFPPYVSGGGYVIPLPAARMLAQVAPYVPLVPVEDVFVTGVLAKVASISHVSHSGFAFWNSRTATVCDILTNKRITSVNMSLKQLYMLGKAALARRGNVTSCEYEG
jgi:hypothetical protein